MVTAIIEGSSQQVNLGSRPIFGSESSDDRHRVLGRCNRDEARVLHRLPGPTSKNSRRNSCGNAAVLPLIPSLLRLCCGALLGDVGGGAPRTLSVFPARAGCAVWACWGACLLPHPRHRSITQHNATTIWYCDRLPRWEDKQSSGSSGTHGWYSATPLRRSSSEIVDVIVPPWSVIGRVCSRGVPPIFVWWCPRQPLPRRLEACVPGRKQGGTARSARSRQLGKRNPRLGWAGESEKKKSLSLFAAAGREKGTTLLQAGRRRGSFWIRSVGHDRPGIPTKAYRLVRV